MIQTMVSGVAVIVVIQLVGVLVRAAQPWDLSPPGWMQLFSHHRTPTERLEFVARHRR